MSEAELFSALGSASAQCFDTSEANESNGFRKASTAATYARSNPGDDEMSLLARASCMSAATLSGT